jgi:hypothetical protein
MDFFKKSAKIRLKSYHSKYLYAEEDEVTAWQSKNGSIRNAEWEVEIDGDDAAVVKLKSCYGCYLSASDVPFLLGMTGQKVMQMKLIHSDLDSSKIRWKPEKEGFGVKLRSTGAGSYLRANGGLPPWRDSVTHDVQNHISQDCIWYVEPVAPAAAKHAVSPDTNPANDLGDPDLLRGSASSAHRPQLSSIPSCSSFTKNLFPIDDSVATTPPTPDVSTCRLCVPCCMYVCKINLCIICGCCTCTYLDADRDCPCDMRMCIMHTFSYLDVVCVCMHMLRYWYMDVCDLCLCVAICLWAACMYAYLVYLDVVHVCMMRLCKSLGTRMPLPAYVYVHVYACAYV